MLGADLALSAGRPATANGIPPSSGGGDSLTIDVYDTESQVFALTSVTNYTIVHAKDTDNLYVWDSSAWVSFNNN